MKSAFTTGREVLHEDGSGDLLFIEVRGLSWDYQMEAFKPPLRDSISESPYWGDDLTGIRLVHTSLPSEGA